MTEKKKGYRLTKIYGTVDELNSWMGMLLYALNQGNDLNAPQLGQLQEIQHRLFDVGGELAMPGYQLITPEHTVSIEHLIDALNTPLPPLANFTLPGGGYTACHTHIVRTVARRAERQILALQESGESVNQPLLAYVNRLSDLFYVLGRHCARQNEGEVLWQASEKQKV